jgi:DNA replication protein DnaC
LRQRLAKSKLNTQKSFEHYDLNFQPELDKKLLAEIRACRFVEERKNIILIGKPGTGKTHLANAIGLEAASKGYSVAFSHLHSLLEKLAQGRADNTSAYHPTNSYSRPPDPGRKNRIPCTETHKHLMTSPNSSQTPI